MPQTSVDRVKNPQYRAEADLSLADYIRPHSNILVGQAAAEPHGLIAPLIELSKGIDGLTVLSGYGLSEEWARVTPARPRVLSYSAHGPFRNLARSGALHVLPCHYSNFDRLVTNGPYQPDVVLLQLPPADADGFHSFGTTVDYVARAAMTAPVVIAEINEQMPQTNTKWRLHSSKITASIGISRPLAGTPAREPSALDHAVAHNVASTIPDGATLQLGIGALAAAIAAALRDHRNLKVRSGLIGDWVLDLRAAGSLLEGSSCATGMALGSPELYDFVGGNDAVEFMPIADLLDADAMAGCDPYVAVNSALEVDLLGQVNSEVVNGAYIGALGSQVDTFRASRIARSGLAIVAMSSRTPSGASQVVAKLTGPVTSLQSDIDMVVTEHGVADIRGTTAMERVGRLIAVAAPEHRDILRANVA